MIAKDLVNHAKTNSNLRFLDGCTKRDRDDREIDMKSYDTQPSKMKHVELFEERALISSSK